MSQQLASPRLQSAPHRNPRLLLRLRPHPPHRRQYLLRNREVDSDLPRCAGRLLKHQPDCPRLTAINRRVAAGVDSRRSKDQQRLIRSCPWRNDHR